MEERDHASRPPHRCIVAAAIVVVGWSIAVAVYVTAAPTVEENGLLYEWENSKRYARQLEVMGGKAVAFTDRLNGWLAGLFQGRPLAYTIAWLTVIVALIYLLLGRRGAGDEGAPDDRSRV